MNEWYDDMTRVVLVRRIVTRRVIVNDNDDDIDSIGLIIYSWLWITKGTLILWILWYSTSFLIPIPSRLL